MNGRLVSLVTALTLLVAAALIGQSLLSPSSPDGVSAASLQASPAASPIGSPVASPVASDASITVSFRDDGDDDEGCVALAELSGFPPNTSVTVTWYFSGTGKAIQSVDIDSTGMGFTQYPDRSSPPIPDGDNDYYMAKASGVVGSAGPPVHC